MRFQLNKQSIRRLGKVAGKIGKRDANELMYALLYGTYDYAKRWAAANELAQMLEYVIIVSRRTPFSYKTCHCSHEQDRPIIYIEVWCEINHFWLGFDLAKLSKYMTEKNLPMIFSTDIGEVYRAYCRNLQYKLDKLGYKYSKFALTVNKHDTVEPRRVIQIIEYYTKIIAKHNGEKN